MNVGREFNTAKIPQIQKGITTGAELVAWFGEPYSKAVDDDGTEHLIWIHAVTTSHAQSYILSMKVQTDMKGQRLIATVKEGKVTSYSFSDGPLTPMPGRY